MDMRVKHWFRATCFNEPCGPWRESKRALYQDLEAQGLGSYDERGTFWVTVPGGYETESAWVPFEEADLTRSVQRNHPAHQREGRAVTKRNGLVGSIR